MGLQHDCICSWGHLESICRDADKSGIMSVEFSCVAADI